MKTFRVPSNATRISMNLNFKTYGTHGHPLIILHGLLGMLDNWQTQSKRYAEAGLKVYALDQRNHGKSPHSDVFNFEAMAADVRGFMQQHGIPSTYLLGHSMGGKAAMQFAMDFPTMVDKLIVVDVAPRKYPNKHDAILDSMSRLDLSNIRSRQQADAELAEGIPEYTTRQFILKNLARTEAGKFRWKANLFTIKQHYGEIADDITANGLFDKPAIFVRGEFSSYIRAEDEPRIMQLFPQAKIVTIAGVGHWVHADAPDKFANVILNFLKSSNLHYSPSTI